MAEITFVRGDITEQEVDAVVNAANHSLLGGGGVDGAIHRRGGPEILTECRRLRETRFPDGLPTGEAVATTAGRLPARWVIHTVGPTWAKTKDRSELLAACYATAWPSPTSWGRPRSPSRRSRPGCTAGRWTTRPGSPSPPCASPRQRWSRCGSCCSATPRTPRS